jgi:CheY-like chemotaxis protein
MANVLLVDADDDDRRAMERALAGSGYAVAVAATGASALESIGRRRPDLVVTQAHLGDMDAIRLFTLAREIPRRRSFPFLLLAGVDATAASRGRAAGMDRVCAGHVSVRSLLGHVTEVLEGGGRSGDAAERAPEAGAPTPAGVPTFQGSLGVMDFPALAQVIGLNGKTGRLELSLAGGAGVVDFVGGQPVHAEFGGGHGEEAFAALVWAAQAMGGDFRFVPAAEGAAEPSRTIHRSVERLLLDVAAWLDEARLGAGAARA